MTYSRYGREWYQANGRKGGTACRDKHDADYYRRIGKLGGQRIRALVEAGKRDMEQKR